MLRESFEEAKQSRDDGRLSIQLRRLFSATENNGGFLQYIDKEVDDIEEWPLSELIEALESWYSDQSFDQALDAMELLSHIIDDAKGRGWNRVSSQLYHRKIKLKAGLSGHTPENELEDALDYLENHREEVLSNNQIQPIIELAKRNVESISDDNLQRWVDLCDEIVFEKRADDRHQQEREFISLKIDLKQELDRSIEPEQERIIESIEAEAEHQGKRSKLIQATVLERGLDRCAEFLPDEKKEEWKRGAVEARRKGADEEMVESSPDEELQEAVAEEAQENSNRLVTWFETTVDTYESSVYALYCLLCSDGYVPSFEMAQNAEKGFVFREAFQTQYTSPEGHAIGVNPPSRAEKERIPSSYPHNIDLKNRTLAEALYRLIDKGEITEFDFHVLFSIANINPHTHAFLTDAVIDLFDSNYIQSLAIAMPHFEGAIVDTLDKIGRSATAKTDDGTQQQAFGGLLEELEDDIEFEYLQYLKVNYTDGRGPNQRNRWSHGQFRYYQANFRTAVITLFDTLKTLIQLDPTPFISVFSLPSETISTQNRRQQGIDISDYLEENHTILAYGYGDDTAVIVAEDKDEDRTPFLVVRGNIVQDYGLSQAALSREKIRDSVELLEDTASVSGSIELTWLDTEDARKKEVSRIISELDDGEGFSRGEVIETAKRFGLSDEQAETAIDSLIDEDNVAISDGVLTAVPKYSDDEES